MCWTLVGPKFKSGECLSNVGRLEELTEIIFELDMHSQVSR